MPSSHKSSHKSQVTSRVEVSRGEMSPGKSSICLGPCPDGPGYTDHPCRETPRGYTGTHGGARVHRRGQATPMGAHRRRAGCGGRGGAARRWVERVSKPVADPLTGWLPLVSKSESSRPSGWLSATADDCVGGGAHHRRPVRARMPACREFSCECGCPPPQLPPYTTALLPFRKAVALLLALQPVHARLERLATGVECSGRRPLPR